MSVVGSDCYGCEQVCPYCSVVWVPYTATSNLTGIVTASQRIKFVHDSIQSKCAFLTENLIIGCECDYFLH